MDGENPEAAQAVMEGQAAADPNAPVGGDTDAPAGGLQFGADGMPVEVEETKEEGVIPPEILESMQNVWNVFDMKKTHQIEIRHLRTIMRALDFNLVPAELKIVEK